MDTPFGTQSIRYLHPVLNYLGPPNLRSARMCSLDKAFIGHLAGGGGGRGLPSESSTFLVVGVDGGIEPPVRN